MQRLLPYLPDGSAEAAEALIAISRDLDDLLAVDNAELWSAVRTDPSIITFLDSYLRNALRPFDDGFHELSDIEHAVWRHAALLFTRLLTAKEGGVPAHADKVKLLSRLLTIPTILDICALFSSISQESKSLSAAIDAMLSLKTSLQSELASTATSIAENLSQVVDACLDAAASARRNPEMLQNVLDGVSYAKDACLSLCAVIKVHPSAAGAFLKNGADIVEALGAVHDQLVPRATGLASNTAHSSILEAQLYKYCPQVEIASEAAVAMLLRFAFLDARCVESAGGSSSSSSSSSSRSRPSAAALVRGESLLNALTLLGHREGVSSGAGSELSLGPALAQRHGLAGTIQNAINSGVVALDDAQADYIAALLDVPSLAEAPVFVPGGGAGPTTSTPSTSTTDTAVMLSLVSQVRDLLPDYGEGFIAACLELMENSPERAINALLEGNLPASVQNLDPKLSFKEYEGTLRAKKQPAAAPAAAPAATLMQSEPRRQQINNLTAKFLDTKETSLVQKVKAVAVESQWEYEDEYDDSYDELMHVGAVDGGADEDNDNLNAAATAVGAAMQVLSLDGEEAGPSGSGRFGQQQQQQQRQLQGGRGAGGKQRGKGGKLWVLDGRIYNYPKPGAKEVFSEAEAHAVLQEAQQASKEIHGLGPGGNKPIERQVHAAGGRGPGSAEQRQEQAGEGIGGGGGRGGGRSNGGGGRGGGGRGRGGPNDHKWKDKHKSAVANHHRKDRAAAKMSKAMQ